MSVEVGNVANIFGLNVISLTTPPFEVAGENRVGVLGLSHSSNGCTSISGSLGGVSAVLIPGTDSGIDNQSRSQIWRVVAPPLGSQTAEMSWTGVTYCMLGAAVLTNVRQTTPAVNGTYSVGTSTTVAVTITSTGGDRTFDVVASGGDESAALSSPTQTLHWSAGQVTFFSGAGSSAAGAGSNVHQWTSESPAPQWASSGANFVQAGVGQQVMGLYNPHPMVI